MDLILMKPKVFQDTRGYLKEIFKNSEFEKYGIPIPIQSNISFSKRGVIRGLHYQLPPKEQGKIITVIKGEIFDVALDIRRNSKTFGKYFGIELSEKTITCFIFLLNLHTDFKRWKSLLFFIFHYS